MEIVVDRIGSYARLALTLLVVLSPLPAAALARSARQQAGNLTVITQNDKDLPVAGVHVEVSLAGNRIALVDTDNNGIAKFTGLTAGSYDVSITRDGFETLNRAGVAVGIDAPIELRFVLVPRVELKDTVDIKATAENPVEQGASPPEQLQRDQIKNIPGQPTTVSDALPLIPGVVRNAQGEIKISGTGENRSAFIVNSADVTDPATGQFGMTVPVDVVERVDVFKTPYLAQFGRFTAGVVSVETRRGGDKWNFELNDPLPEFRWHGVKLQGLRAATPRVVFNGPLIKQKLYISEGTEYAIRKRPVKTLPFPINETKSESINSFTQIDYLASATHTLTGTFHVSPRQDEFVNLDYFNQQPVTPNFRARDYTGTMIDRWTLGQSLLESTIALKRNTAHVWGQGIADMQLTPTGSKGNYFSEQDRRSSRFEWLETLSLKPLGSFHGSGTHNFKFGTMLAQTSNTGDFRARPVDIEDVNGQLLRRIEFTGGQPFHRADTELALFGQDHWSITKQLSLDLGTRLERQGITETFRVAPRAGIAFMPFAHGDTVIRAGFGIFYDRVPLSVYSFNSYPQQVITTYGPGGAVIDGPRVFANITDRAETSSFPFIHSGSNVGNFAPYSETWNIEGEHSVTQFLRLRVNYLHSNSYGVVTLTPKVVQGQDALVLGGGGKSRYRQLELTARVSMKEGQQLFFSYVHSKAKGDINEFTNYLGNFPYPLVRLNEFSNLPADLPHRFLAWGQVHLPWKLRLFPLVEYRSGFPFSVTDELQNFVGPANTFRFPRFFSFDARIARDFQVTKKYGVRFAVSGFNLTNHFNALDVHRNIADPQFGTFFGNFRRRARVDFDVIF
jgi:Carboxypeptidase regulatory-like domain/TonB dependent receptor-like, beta-barrel/TonB-dependent Receptor Plug Domain